MLHRLFHVPLNVNKVRERVEKCGYWVSSTDVGKTYKWKCRDFSATDGKQVCRSASGS